MPQFPHVRVTGPAEERGRQYGEQARDRVRRSVTAYRELDYSGFLAAKPARSGGPAAIDPRAAA